jgi:hypothetical protein
MKFLEGHKMMRSFFRATDQRKKNKTIIIDILIDENVKSSKKYLQYLEKYLHNQQYRELSCDSKKNSKKCYKFSKLFYEIKIEIQ